MTRGKGLGRVCSLELGSEQSAEQPQVGTRHRVLRPGRWGSFQSKAPATPDVVSEPSRLPLPRLFQPPAQGWALTRTSFPVLGTGFSAVPAHTAGAAPPRSELTLIETHSSQAVPSSWQIVAYVVFTTALCGSDLITPILKLRKLRQEVVEL